MKTRTAKTQQARRLRSHCSEAERKLWTYLRNRRFENLKFKRQVVIGPYIADFSCYEKKLIIELDGGQHMTQTDYDDRQTRYLEKCGYKVIRFWNHDVLAKIESVLMGIWLEVGKGDSSG